MPLLFITRTQSLQVLRWCQLHRSHGFLISLYSILNNWVEGMNVLIVTGSDIKFYQKHKKANLS